MVWNMLLPRVLRIMWLRPFVEILTYACDTHVLNMSHVSFAQWYHTCVWRIFIMYEADVANQFFHFLNLHCQFHSRIHLTLTRDYNYNTPASRLFSTPSSFRESAFAFIKGSDAHLNMICRSATQVKLSSVRGGSISAVSATLNASPDRSESESTPRAFDRTIVRRIGGKRIEIDALRRSSVIASGIPKESHDLTRSRRKFAP